MPIFFAHFVQPFPLAMLYNPLQRRFLSNFHEKLLIKLVFILNNNAFHMFLYRKFNAFHVYILNQQFYKEKSIHFCIVKFNVFFLYFIHDVLRKSWRRKVYFEEKTGALCALENSIFSTSPHLYLVNVREQNSNDGYRYLFAALQMTEGRWQEVKRVLTARADK